MGLLKDSKSVESEAAAEAARALEEAAGSDIVVAEGSGR